MLQEADYVRFNHWLLTTRARLLVAVLVAAVVFLCLPAASSPVRLLPVLLLCAVDLVLWFAFRSWLSSMHQLRVLAYTQLVADVLIIVSGLFFVHTDPLLFHFALLLPVLPASLIEWQCGIAIATLASLGHFVILWVTARAAWLSVGGILPPTAFVLAVAQSVFYARQLGHKNAALAAAAESLNESNRLHEEEAAVSTALLRTARALTMSLDSHDILQRFNEVLRGALASDCSVTLLHDAKRDSYRVAAASCEEPDMAARLSALELPRQAHPLFAAVAEHELVAAEDQSSPLFPPALLQYRISSFLGVDLRRAGSSVGVLLVGFADRTGPFSQRDVRLVRSSAQQAAVALENARLVESLRAASRLKSEFIGTMSHELRSPLNVVIGYVDLILEGDMGEVDPEQYQALQKVQQHALQLLELIQETLDINRLEAGLLPLDLETFTVRDFLAELQQSIPTTWRKPNVELLWPAADGTLRINSDRAKLKKILRNLIHNAFKFTDHGLVTVGVRAEDGWVNFMISDTGIGIGPDVVPVIFDLFRQGDGSTTRRHSGVGLGLYIVKQLVRGLGGDVTVSSTQGAGSTFYIRMRSRE